MASSPYETQAILNLQRYLRQLSRFDPDIPMVDEDGIFGEATRMAVEAFQRKYKLPITGTVDAETWNRLFNEYLLDVEQRTRPDPIYIFPRNPADYSVGPGDEGILVELIQLLIRDIITLYGRDVNLLPIDGVYGPRTEEAVKDFQRVNQLPDSGRVDRVTWNRLARIREPLVNQYPKE